MVKSMETQIYPHYVSPRYFMTIILVIGILMITGGCIKPLRDEDSETTEHSSATDTLVSSADVSDPTDTTEPETTAVTETETTPESTLLTDINSLEIYSSHAYMVSFDPSTGLAEFDYFDFLQGQDAIDWLVEHEGYTQEDAENEVNNWADTEGIEKNINSRLRVIDMRTVPIVSNSDENGYLELPAVSLTYSEFIDRIDDFIYSSTNHPSAYIVVLDGEIEYVNVDYFMG